MTIVVPFPPGGNTDTMARLLAQKRETELLGGEHPAVTGDDHVVGVSIVSLVSPATKSPEKQRFTGRWN